MASDANGFRVGVIGMGRMGVPIALNLVRAGLDVTVYNRNRARCEPVAEQGASVADSPADLARSTDVVLSIVADDAASERVMLGEDGVLAGAREGQVIYEMSTIAPDLARRLAETGRERGVAVLDSPVSGSTALAESAQLMTMVGGDRDAFERTRSVLEPITRSQWYLGPSGAGATVKLAINSMIAVTNQALAESLVLAERAGIDRAAAYDAIKDSAISSPYVNYKQAAFLDPENTPVAFTIRLMQKDVALTLALARDLDVPMLMTSQAGQGLALAASRYGDQDLSRVADLVRELAGG